MTFEYSGLTWTVYLADPTKVDELVGCDGLTDASGYILVDQNLSDDQKVVVLIHELLHVVFTVPQHGDILTRVFGAKREEDVQAIEERVVSYMAAPLSGLLKSIFKLRLPK